MNGWCDDGGGDVCIAMEFGVTHLLRPIYCDFNGSRFISLSPRTMAAVYAQVGPGHEAARITDQEDGSTPVFLRLAQSSQHILLRPLGLPLRELVEELGDHSRDNIAWRNGVHADAVLAPFGGEISPELEDGGFGGVVGGADEALNIKCFSICQC